MSKTDGPMTVSATVLNLETKSGKIVLVLDANADPHVLKDVLATGDEVMIKVKHQD